MTAPLETVKSVASKDAIPLLEEDASSAEIVIALLLTAVSIPSPPEKVRVSVPTVTSSLLPESAAMVKSPPPPPPPLTVTVFVAPVPVTVTPVPTKFKVVASVERADP